MTPQGAPIRDDGDAERGRKSGEKRTPPGNEGTMKNTGRRTTTMRDEGETQKGRNSGGKRALLSNDQKRGTSGADKRRMPRRINTKR